MLAVFVQALVLGFSIAAPVGAIGVLCIRRSLAEGRAVGLACGLGAATADALYGLIAGLGLVAVTSALVGSQLFLRTAGSAYLVYLGVRTFMAVPAERPAEIRPDSGRILRAWASTAFLTLTNPVTIMSFVAIFASLGRNASLPGRAPILAVGVFLGSAAWWLILSTAVSRLRGRVRPIHLVWVNRASGAILIGFAIGSAAGLLG